MGYDAAGMPKPGKRRPDVVVVESGSMTSTADAGEEATGVAWGRRCAWRGRASAANQAPLQPGHFRIRQSDPAYLRAERYMDDTFALQQNDTAQPMTVMGDTVVDGERLDSRRRGLFERAGR